MRALGGIRFAALGALLLALGLLAHRLTGGFEHATHESLRQNQAARGELRAAAVELLDTRGQALQRWVGAAAPGPAGAAASPVVTILDFIYTRCTTMCLSLGTTFQQLQGWMADEPAAAAGVGLLSVSFDPLHDDGPALAHYARLHRADPALWRVARTATVAQTHALLQSLGVVVIPDGDGGYAHNAALHLVDRHGRLLAIYPLGEARLALQHATRLAREQRP